jgi:hypothetical protein
MVRKVELKSRCSRCGGHLESVLDQLEGVCSQLSCRGPHLVEKRRQAEREKREAWAATIEELKKAFPELLTDQGRDEVASEQQAHVSLVPGTDSPLVPLPPDRHEQFLAHLDVICREAVRLCDDPKKVNSLMTEYGHRGSATKDSPILPVLNGCSTCRGYCCRNGGDHAFLDASFVAWQLLCDPCSTAESVRNAYIHRLPDVSVEGSCVFHGSQGCVLSRAERNNVCNNFHCFELQDAIEQHSEGESRAWIAVARSDTGALRVGKMDSSGNQTRRETSGP